MDALAHVNNTVYFKWFEDARLHIFKNLDIASVTTSSPTGPILAYIDCQFAKALTYPDQIIVGSWIPKIGNTSMEISHVTYSEVKRSIVAKSKSIVVMVDYQIGQKVAIPEEWRKRIDQIQEGFSLDSLST